MEHPELPISYETDGHQLPKISADVYMKNDGTETLQGTRGSYWLIWTILSVIVTVFVILAAVITFWVLKHRKSSRSSENHVPHKISQSKREGSALLGATKCSLGMELANSGGNASPMANVQGPEANTPPRPRRSTSNVSMKHPQPNVLVGLENIIVGDNCNSSIISGF